MANSTTFKEDWRIRQTTSAEALWLIDPGLLLNDAAKGQIPGFITTLGNMDRRLNQIAAEALALGKVGDTRAVANSTTFKDEAEWLEVWKEWQKKNEMEARSAALKPWIAALRDKDWQIRQAAAEALGRTDPDLLRSEAVEALIIALNMDRGIRKAAAQALGQIGDTRAVEPLIVALRDTWEDWVGSRSAVVDALGRIDPDWPRSEAAKRQIPTFISALVNKKDDGVRWAAAEALVKIGAPAVEPLIAALRDRHFDVRSTVVAALSRIVPDWPRSEAAKRQVPMFIAALGDEDWRVRWAAAEDLGQIGDARAVEPLIAALKDKDNWVRLGAAEALGWVGDTRAAEPLIVALRDKMENVRRGAVQSLERISPRWTQHEAAKRQVPALIAALRDEDVLMRTVVARTLGQIGDVRALKPLTPLLWDADAHLRQEAVLAIAGIITPQQDSALLRLKMTFALTLNALVNALEYLMSSLLLFLIWGLIDASQGKRRVSERRLATPG